jgi:L-amino acid N-acyltransferase YncA
MTGEIRSVSVDDAPAIHAIYAPYVAETVISFEATPPRIEEIAARIQKNTAKYPWLVYMADGAADGVANGQKSGAPALAGYVYASSHRERAAYQWSVDVSVYMSPAYQRLGIGRGLYTALFELLRAQGYVNAYAGIALPNAGSVGIHEALGFTPVGVYHQVGYKLGNWHDVGWWSLRLDEPRPQPVPPRAITEFIDTPVWSSALRKGLALIPD